MWRCTPLTRMQKPKWTARRTHCEGWGFSVWGGEGEGEGVGVMLDLGMRRNMLMGGECLLMRRPAETQPQSAGHMANCVMCLG